MTTTATSQKRKIKEKLNPEPPKRQRFEESKLPPPTLPRPFCLSTPHNRTLRASDLIDGWDVNVGGNVLSTLVMLEVRGCQYYLKAIPMPTTKVFKHWKRGEIAWCQDDPYMQPSAASRESTYIPDWIEEFLHGVMADVIYCTLLGKFAVST